MRYLFIIANAIPFHRSADKIMKKAMVTKKIIVRVLPTFPRAKIANEYESAAAPSKRSPTLI